MSDEQISAALAATERFGHPSRWKWRLWLVRRALLLGAAFFVENLASLVLRLIFPRYVPVLERHFPWDSTEDWIKRTLPPEIIEMACGEPNRPVPADIIEAIQVNIGRGKSYMDHYRALLYGCVPWLFLGSIFLVLGVDLWYLLRIETALVSGLPVDAALTVLGYICVMTSTAMGIGVGARSR